MDLSFDNTCKTFYAEHGYDARLLLNYQATLTRICDAIKNTYEAVLTDAWWIVDETCSRNYYIETGTTKYCTIIGKLETSEIKILMQLPYPTEHSFIIDGVEKVITSLDVFYPSPCKITRPVGSGMTKTDLSCEIRNGVVGYKSTTVMVSRSQVAVNINAFRNLTTGPKSNLMKRSIHPVLFIGVLLPNQTAGEIIDMILEKTQFAEAIRIHLELEFANDVVLTDDVLRAGIQRYVDTKDVDECMRAIGYHMHEYATGEQYAHTVALMVASILEVMTGHSPIVDLCNIHLKRIDTYAAIIERGVMWELRSTSPRNKQYAKSVIAALNNIGVKTTENVKSGNLRSYFRVESTGVVQTLSNKSELDMLSHARRIRIACDSSSANTLIRQVHSDEYGFICPFETPEGKEVGLVRYLAMTCLITDDIDEGAMQRLRTVLAESETSDGRFFLILDGMYHCRISKDGITRLRELRESQPEYRFCSVSMRRNYVFLYTEKGRMIRPLLRTSDGKFDYIDQYEQSSDDVTVRFEPDPQATHVEIHGSCQMGMAAAVAPFANHSQASRIAFQAAMSKKSIGCDPYYLRNHVDGSAYMWYGQRDICSTTMSRILTDEQRTTGINVVIAIVSMGFNQEDAIVMNSASVRRGMFATTKFKTVRRTVHPNSDTFVNGRFNSTVPCDEEGVILEGTMAAPGTVLMAIYRSSVDEEQMDRVQLTGKLPHRVAKVTKTKFDDRGSIRSSVCLDMQSTNYVQIGDKFASRYSQKGIVGKLLDPWDLPYTASGIVPDLVINPHAIPSRMTMGHLLEMAIGRQMCRSPERGRTGFDATPLVDAGSVEDIPETLYNAEDGQPVETEVFLGVCFYQALKHQVVDKYHSRAVGPVSAVSHQPVEGKAKGGGMRIGEMEKDALIGYGCTEIIREKFMHETDAFETVVCTRCQTMLNSQTSCYVCGDRPDAMLEIPYSFKLISQTLRMAGIDTRVEIDPAAYDISDEDL